MQITQEEEVHVAVTKKEEPPRARGTCDLSIHGLLYLPYSLYQMHWLWVFVVVVFVAIVVCLFFFVFEIMKMSSLLCLSYYYMTAFHGLNEGSSS